MGKYIEQAKKNKVIQQLRKALKGLSFNVSLVDFSVINIIDETSNAPYIITPATQTVDNKQFISVHDVWDLMAVLFENGYEYEGESKQYSKFNKDDVWIYIQKQIGQPAYFTIELTDLLLTDNDLYYKFLDTVSYETKKLVPLPEAFKSKEAANEALARADILGIYGFELPMETYRILECNV